MSDSSSESCDDSDLDPDFVIESNESECNESDGGSLSEGDSTMLLIKNKSVEKDSLSVLKFQSSKSEARPGSPSVIGSLNLSESDSDDDKKEEKQEPISTKVISETKSSYFLEVNDAKCENTDYDFSQILALQNRVSQAREQYEKDKMVAKETLGPKELDVSVSELLAIGETNVSEDGSSENEPEEPEKKTIQITLESQVRNSQLNKVKKQTSMFEKQLLLIQKENQLLMHKVHLLCLIAHGNFINSFLISSEKVYSKLLSLLPKEYAPPLNFTSSYVKMILKWFGKKFEVSKDIRRTGLISAEHLIDIALSPDQRNYSLKDLVVLFVSLLRGLGLITRLVISLQPVPLKPKKLIQISDKKQNKESVTTEKVDSVIAGTSKTNKHKKSKPQSPTKASPSKVSVDRRKKKVTVVDKKLVNKTQGKGKAQLNKTKVKVLSSDSEESEESVKSGVNYWAEVYIEKEETWISVDIYSMKVDCSNEIYARCTQPVAYIIAWKNDNTLKDVTRRYVPSWHIVSKKSRVDQNWFNESISSFRGQESIFDRLEEEKLDHSESQMKAPIPTKISDLKNHPLYALQRHLLKFEAIYPPDAVPLGYIRGEAVYSRFCVNELFSREKWIRQGKCVKVNEKPYKIVKSRSKSDRFPGTEKPLELFGHWQVVDYIPPPVIDNKIPRNEYGNIEVYKPNMLPIGTVHLRVPGIPKIAKKMDIDCAPAVIGWEHHGGRSHPIIEGVVVCKEFQDVLMDAWCAENEASAQRTDHKRKQNSFKKWLKFVKHELIKVHLKRKYNFGDPKNEDNVEPPKKEKNTL